MKHAAWLWLLVLTLTCGLRASAQDKLTSPKPGDPVRKTLFNLLRPPVEKEMGVKVIFQVNKLRMLHGWAFLDAEMLQPNQKPIDYKKTLVAKQYEDGMFGGGAFGLFHKVNGKWKLVTYRVGPTDVAYATWWRDYKAPRSIFPYNE